MQIELADNFHLDTQDVLTGRCCVIGQSGSGKSYLVGVVAEELCKLKMPFVVIDTEGEYKSLKSLASVVTVGSEDCDLGLDVDYTRLIESSIASRLPVVLDVSGVVGREDYVYRFLEGLYEVEERERSPYLIIIEEADTFVPQVTKARINIIEEISVRGRKRGIGLLVATQRPANISKNVLAQCSYGFIGKLTIENDLAAVKTLFEDRRKLAEIPKLGTGEFIPFGLQQDAKLKVKARSAAHMGATPVLHDVAVQQGIGELISSMKGAGQKAAAMERGGALGRSITAILPKQTVEQARLYATKMMKRRFVVFGSNTEVLDKLAMKYMPLVELKLRMPTGKRNEYYEAYLFVAGKYLVRFGAGVELREHGIGRFVKWDRGEVSVLGALRRRKRMTFDRLEDETGITRKELSKAVVKLAKSGMAKDNGEYVAAVDFGSFLSESMPELGSVGTEEAVFEPKKEPTPKKTARDVAKQLFPDASVVEAHGIYLPFYEAILRNGPKLRIFRIDAIFGKEMITN